MGLLLSADVRHHILAAALPFEGWIVECLTHDDCSDLSAIEMDGQL